MGEHNWAQLAGLVHAIEIFGDQEQQVQIDAGRPAS